jgi:hypothetical protein
MRRFCPGRIVFVLVVLAVLLLLAAVSCGNDRSAVILDTVGQGTVSKSPDQDLYAPGTQITVTATPETGWAFDYWVTEGADNYLRDNPYTFTMWQEGRDWVWTAHFVELTPYALIVSVVGQGTVAKSPDQEGYYPGTQITLTATPNNGWVFDYWDGDNIDAVVHDNPLTVTMLNDGEDKHLIAYFVQKNKPSPVTTLPPVTTIPVTTTAQVYTLSVSKEGDGTVSKSPDQASYAPGTVVTLTATPAARYYFDGWTDSNGNPYSANPLTVTMDGNKSYKATFSWIVQ